MRVLLVSTYELGHQPLQVASPAAALQAAGHEVRAVDLAVQQWDESVVDWAEAVAFSVPMHTATRMARRAVDGVRARRPDLPVALYGLYAGLAGDVADRVIAGEYEPELVAWANDLARPRGTTVDIGRYTDRFLPPARDSLPGLDRYAHVVVDGEERVVGYVEASHGCAHHCRHCPVPVVYDGRTRIVAADTVLDDVARLVEMGARHITFGDPDFLNAVHHSTRIVDELHRRWPDLTFDLTAKVEHILRHRDIWPRLAAAGCLFVISAFESVNDEILLRLDKGHTAADGADAIAILRGAGIEPRPTWLVFTPWTAVTDVAEILRFVLDHDLVGNVDPVQLTIRLLVPEGSLLLQDPSVMATMHGYDDDRLSWTWTSPDPAVDALQQRLAALVETGQAAGQSEAELFEAILETVRRAHPDAERVLAGAPSPELGSFVGKPRLTEPWFCCSEPTEIQLSSLSAH